MDKKYTKLCAACGTVATEKQKICLRCGSRESFVNFKTQDNKKNTKK
jgi:rRNA maturation endonuclease Nob1